MEDILKRLSDSNLKEVSKDTGIPYDRMYKWIRGKSKPKTADTDTLVKYFDGNFSNSSNVERNFEANPVLRTEAIGVPYYDIDFIGGFDLVENNQSVKPIYYIDFLPFNDADCWLNVTGKSMGPLIAHGDIVALKEVSDWQTFLLEGEMYAIVTFNGFRTIKIVGSDPDNRDNYMLIPYNKNGDYRPQAIPKKVITRVFRVKGAIKKFF